MGAAAGTTQNVATPASTGHIVNGSSASEVHVTNPATTGQGKQRYDFEMRTYKFGE